MHGNSLSAVGAAIGNSQCIIICMSENYEKINACHHEAELAYVRQRHIVPLVVQPKYKARQWLDFIIGASIYVGFTKYEFDRAFGMLEEEMKSTDKVAEQTIPEPAANSDKKKIEYKKQDDISKDPVENKVESKKQISTMHENKHINQWTSDDVISWCYTHKLSTFAQLLEDYDGASLLRLHNMAKIKGDNDMFRLLQDDCERIANNGQIKLTLTEFVRFQIELDKKLERDTTRSETIPAKNSKSGILCPEVIYSKDYLIAFLLHDIYSKYHFSYFKTIQVASEFSLFEIHK